MPFCRLIIHPPCLSCAECRAAPAAEQRCQRALVTAGLAARGLGIQRPARGSPFAQHAELHEFFTALPLLTGTGRGYAEGG